MKGLTMMRLRQRLTHRLGNRDAPRLIFVLGAQRSGTNALRRSLSLDPFVMGFNEAKSSALYEDWKLRPEPVIRDHLARYAGRTVLLKPIQSVLEREVADFLGDFAAYDVSVAWIFRDPVNVYASYAKRWPSRADPRQFGQVWNRVNRSALAAAARDPRIHVVRYEDLVADRATFTALGRALRVRGEYIFAADSNSGYRVLEPAARDELLAATAAVLGELDAQRTARPRVPAAQRQD